MHGYYRFPAIRGDRIVFLSDDDLWSVPVEGGLARRLTAGLGDASRPVISPDGQTIAYTGRDETHPEVFCMSADGGPARRLTFFGTMTTTVGFTPSGSIVFASNDGQFSPRMMALYTIRPDGTDLQKIAVGPAREIAFGPQNSTVIGRNSTDPARWKRYKGGTHGDLWVDAEGEGNFRRLIALTGNRAHPMWIGERIYFVSDHEGVGNVYSCSPTGTDLKRHTDHEDYYVRFPSADGARIAYQAGGTIFVLDTATNATQLVPIKFHSPRVQLNRKFVTGETLFEDFSVHPDGHSVAIVNRGKCHQMPLWEQAPTMIGKPQGVRYRMAQWLHDGSAIVAISDDGGDEALEIFPADATLSPKRLNTLDLGRAVEMVASPVAKKLAITNHRLELIVVDLDTETATVALQNPYERLGRPAWSPDGRWVAFSHPVTTHTTTLSVLDVEKNTVTPISSGDFRDLNPAWDPEGKFLYFISFRVFDPVYDSFYFQVGFPRGSKPYLVALQKDSPPPFENAPKGFGDKKNDEPKKPDADGAKAGNGDGDGAKAGDGEAAANGGSDAAAAKPPKPVEIDFEGIESRIVALPVEEGLYADIAGIKGKVVFTSFPVEGALGRTWADLTPEASGTLHVYSFDDQEAKELFGGVSSFKIAHDGATMVYRSGNKLRALKAGEKPNADATGNSRKSGWIDLSRIRFVVEPMAEWRQMYREAWRLMRDHFWTADMSGMDWQQIHDRYLPILDRVGTRLEFSDLMWEIQGELGTSHAYEMGGDVRKPPVVPVGHLGADITFDPQMQLYRLTRIVRGASWDADECAPLAAVGVNVNDGDTILAVGGHPVTPTTPPRALLVNLAGQKVELTIGDSSGANPRAVVVKTLRDEFAARYREWVETNRRYVHEKTDGRVGYVHVPNMGPQGFAEFHRYYLRESTREALVVDVRFNGGGHVSQLLLEKLARKRIGYDLRRWGEPMPYPEHSVGGPIVCLTNEHAGSDGDIFSHCFKLMKLGPLIGKRTWGGVIGIWPRHALVDGSITTQPEFSFWFVDVGFKVENYGTDPDYDIDIAPQDYVAGHDPQMEKALDLIMTALATHPPTPPDFGEKPQLAPAPLPPRI